MSSVSDSHDFPEIFFGIAGPIGVDVVAISDSLQNALRSVRYGSEVIHLTKEMVEVELTSPPAAPVDKNFYSDVNYKIEYANQLCAEFKQPDALARIALRTISHRREELSGGRKKSPTQSTAYIIRQLKRPEEVFLLRKVYGKRFVLISAYGPAEQRTKLIEERLKKDTPSFDTTRRDLRKGMRVNRKRF